jgi:hypothetical protein
MGKAGRFACIFTPMAMTIASLICLVIVLSGQAYNKSEVSRGLYFFKVRLAFAGVAVLCCITCSRLPITKH